MIVEKILNGFLILCVDTDIRFRRIVSYILPQRINMYNIRNTHLE